MMEPAPLEHLSTLRSKSGSDVDKEIYAFKDKGGREVGLRFDLTVGMTRYVCSRRDLRPPVKLASLAGAWRYDEPQHARYRWFRQWDLEIFGPPSVDADAEVIEATVRLFERLGVKDFSVQVGDRGAVQDFVNRVLGVVEPARATELMRALDKAQKKGLAELQAEYSKKGFDPETLAKLFEFGKVSGSPEKVLSALAEAGAEATALAALKDSLASRGLGSVSFNMGIVRGIDYYTGTVFEVVDEAHKDLGSLAGGGRYDLLPRAFGRPDLSATGAAGGMERTALAISGKKKAQPTLVYVAAAGPEALAPAARLLSELRSEGVPADGALVPRSLTKQLEDASRLGASWVLILGEKELASRSATLRDMATGNEETVPMDDAVNRLKRA